MRLLSKAFLYLRTLRHLRFIQLRYQLLYRFHKHKKADVKSYNIYESSAVHPIAFTTYDLINGSGKYLGSNRFCFLNSTHCFSSTIDWKIQQHGRLWNYNLQYFDYLSDSSYPLEERLQLVKQFARALKSSVVELEPYPTSLRIINWILFLSANSLRNGEVESSIKQQINFLERNLEFHILANHLLENYYSLMFAALWLRDETLFKKAFHGLEGQLKEQVLEDGGHYEASPMYHTILLSRLIILLDAYRNSAWHVEVFENLKQHAGKMISWISQMSIDGDFPHFGDSTSGVAPPLHKIISCAAKLDIGFESTTLNATGYRKLDNNGMVLFFDVGNIQPSYQPGHAHSDALAIALYYNKKPVLIDPGISTYEPNERRQIERSTFFHNTVTVDKRNQSEVWSAFRVGKRATVQLIDDKPDLLSASHNGYRNLGVSHKRSIVVTKSGFEVLDLVSDNGRFKCEAHFHFNHSLNDDLQVERNSIFIRSAQLRIIFDNSLSLRVDEFRQPLGYNILTPAKKVSVAFKAELVTKILFN